jgi:hypothetical protein
VENGCFKSRDKTERAVKLCFPVLAGRGTPNDAAAALHCFVVLKHVSVALPGARVAKNFAEERAWLVADAKQESSYLGVFYERCEILRYMAFVSIYLLMATAECLRKRILAAHFPIGTLSLTVFGTVATRLPRCVCTNQARRFPEFFSNVFPQGANCIHVRADSKLQYERHGGTRRVSETAASSPPPLTAL